MSFKLSKKAVSIFTLGAFIFTNICTNSIYAAPSTKSVFKNKKVNYKQINDKNEEAIQKKKAILSGEDVNQAATQKKETQRVLSSHLSDISLIHIPEELGRVVEAYQNPKQDNSRLVVHIQDLHTNPEASLHLASILEILVKDYNLGLVCSEGADGEVDTSSVSSFPDAETREKVAKLFVDSGELTGEEYLSITKYPKLPIWGIEDKEIYFKNIEQFNSIMKFNPESQVFISQAKKALEELKPRVYSKELLAIGQKESDYENQKVETADYLKYLSGYIQKLSIPTTNYKNVSLLNETISQESRIDQQKIMQELQGLLMNLQSAIAGESNRSDMDTLMAKASLFKDQKISPFSFYSYLKDLADKYLKGQLSKYPNITEFTDYLAKVNSLDSAKLFTEMEDLTYDIKQRLARNDEERKLTQASRNIKFLDGFFNLKVSNEELDYYLENRDSHKVAFFEAFLKPELQKYNISSFVDFNPSLIDSHLQELEDFYKTAKSRDIEMFNNSISEIEKRNVKVAALITGGFHTRGLTQLLKDKGYSYIVISPYSKTEIDEENYHFLLSGKRKPIEELINQLDIPAEKTNKVSVNLRVPLTFSKDSVDNRIAGLMGFYVNEAQDLIRDAFDVISSESDGHAIADAFNQLQNLVANNEALIVVIIERMLELLPQQETITKANLLKWRPREEGYPAALIRSAVNKPEAWKPFFVSAGEDALRGMRIFSGNRGVFERARKGEPGFATTVIKGSDLSEALPEQIIDITNLKPEELQKLMESGMPSHVLAPMRGKVIYCCALLGGAGSRYQESLVRNPRTLEQIRKMLPPGLRTYATSFKASLPVSDDGMTILSMQLGPDDTVAKQGFVTMASYNNAVEARMFLEEELKAKGALQPNIELFVQPITPRRIPTEEAFRAFAAKEKIVEKGKITQQEFDATIAFCKAHAGEIALDSGNKPIFGPENHWDFIKNLVQGGSLLELIEQMMTDDQVRDVVLRVYNQDDLGPSLGKGRPSQAAISALVGNMQRKDGLYNFLEEIDSMGDVEWEIYRNSEEYREKLVEKIGAVVEGGLTPAYSTTGGFIGRFLGKGLVVAERANIQGETPQTNVTNSNTINESLLAIAAMCGLRPKDLKKMIEEKRRNHGRLTDAQRIELEKRVLSAEERVPVRQQVKIVRTKDKRVLPIQGAERDMHGMLGRPGGFGMMLLIGESMETYKKQMKEHDKSLLAGQIDFAEHQKREAGLTLNLTFVPNKDLEQWQASNRIQRSLLKNLGYKQDSPVRSPGEVLAGLQNPTAESFLKALQDEGYYLDANDLPLARAFLENKTVKLAAADETPATESKGSVLGLLYALADNPPEEVEFTVLDVQKNRINLTREGQRPYSRDTVRNELNDAVALGLLEKIPAKRRDLPDKYKVIKPLTKRQIEALAPPIQEKLNRSRIRTEETGEISSAIQEVTAAKLASNETLVPGRVDLKKAAQALIGNLNKLVRIPGDIEAGVGLADIHGRVLTPDNRFFKEDGTYTEGLERFMDSLSNPEVQKHVEAGLMYYDIRSKFWAENPEFTVALALAYAKKLQEAEGKDNGIIVNIGVDAYAKHFKAAQLFVDTILRTGICDNGGGINYWGVINGGSIRNYSQLYHAKNNGKGGNWFYFTMSHRPEDFWGAKIGVGAKVFCGPNVRHCEGVTDGTLFDYIVGKNFAQIRHNTPTGTIVTVSNLTRNNIEVAGDMVRATSAGPGVANSDLLKGARIYVDMAGSPIGKNLVDMLIALGADVEVGNSTLEPNYNTSHIIDPNELNSATHQLEKNKELRVIARRTGRIVIVVDPDGDRFSFVALDENGNPVAMTGSQLLLLTIENMARAYKAKGKVPRAICDMRTGVSARDLGDKLTSMGFPVEVVPYEAGYPFFMRGMADAPATKMHPQGADVAVENTCHYFTNPMTNPLWGATEDFSGYQGGDDAALAVVYLLGGINNQWQGRNPVEQLGYILKEYQLKPTVVDERKPALPPHQDRYKYLIADKMKDLAQKWFTDKSDFVINFDDPNVSIVSGVHITNVRTNAMMLARFSNTGSSFTISGEGYTREELDEMLALGYELMKAAVAELHAKGQQFDFNPKDAASLEGKFNIRNYLANKGFAEATVLENMPELTGEFKEQPGIAVPAASARQAL